MAIYRLKRKTFGVVGDAAKNTLGGATEMTGKALNSDVGGTLGGVAGAGIATGGALGIGGLGLGVPGAIGGYVVGKALTKGVGKGLKNAGQDMQT